MSSIFDRENAGNVGSDLQKVRTVYTPEFMWDDEIAHDLNTYRCLNPISLNSEPVFDAAAGEKNNFESQPFPKGGNAFEGRFSLFNHTMAVGNNTNAQVALNAPLFDSPTIRTRIRENSDCSVKALVKASEDGKMGRAIYRYSDFMFCKHLGRISNNYLITLRRFPLAPGDHINYTLPEQAGEVNEHIPDMGRLVTWLGTPGNDMASILKYDVNLPYKEMRAEIQQNNVTADGGSGWLGGLMNIGSQDYRNKTLNGAAGSSGIGFVQKALTPFGVGSKLSAPDNTSWAYWQDKNKAYGPVDAIAQTHIRSGAEEGGLKFEHKINLTFDYELRAFDGINTRAAMLDLLSNVLVVCYANATTYWPGAIRSTGASQSNVFANLPIFHMQSPVSMAGLTSAMVGTIKDIGSVFNNGKPIGSLSDVMNALGNLGQGVADTVVGGFLNTLGRPQRQGFNSLLTFQPTGVWHLMIGNPRHPIMSMGNMIMDSCSIEHYGPLGLDDFPTGLKVTITLSHGMPRDNLKIEQMYMNGDFRIYQPLGNRGYQAWEQAYELYSNAEKSSTAIELESSISPSANISNSTETEDLSRNSNIRMLGFRKYFGSTDPINIDKTIKEADHGSEPKSLDIEQQAKEDLAKKQTAAEKKK